MTGTPDPAVATSPPAAVGGSRVRWHEIPEVVRAGIEERLGSTVVSAVSQPGGFSPGSADRVVLADGRRAFVKALGTEVDPDSPAIHRRELAVTAALPDVGLAPRLLGGYGDGAWVALAFDDVDGRSPRTPWTIGDVTRCLAALGEMAEQLTPSPPPDLPRPVDAVAGDFTRWDALVDDVPSDLDPWAAHALTH